METTVQNALEAYLAENGFTFEAYDAKWTDASFLGIPLAVPNTPKHRWGIMLHDLHHVATGFGTDMTGEGEISAWELRSLRALGFYVGSIVLVGALIGFIRSSRRVLAAYRAAGRTLFDHSLTYDEARAMTVSELRKRLGVPQEGMACGARGLHTYAPRTS